MLLLWLDHCTSSDCQLSTTAISIIIYCSKIHEAWHSINGLHRYSWNMDLKTKRCCGRHVKSVFGAASSKGFTLFWHRHLWIDDQLTAVPCVINAVHSKVVGLSLLLLFACRGRVQLPVVQTVQKHLGKVIHRLPLAGDEMSKLVDHKVRHTLTQTQT